VVFGLDETTVPSVRTNLFDSKTQALRSVLFSYAQTATQGFQKIFDGKKVFDNPKHSEDIRKLVDYLSDEGDIVLDFFTGSGSTAHAVMLTNGRREYILVQFPEAISAKKSTGKRALELGLKKVSDITIERNKRVIAKVQEEAEGLLPNDPQREFVDSLGFKVNRLAKSNFPRVEFAPDPEKRDGEHRTAQTIHPGEGNDLSYAVGARHGSERSAAQKRLHARLHAHAPPRVQEERSLPRQRRAQGKPPLPRPKPRRCDRGHFKTHPEHFFICLELALDTTKKWNLKHHPGDKLKAF